MTTAPIWSRDVLLAQLLHERYGDPRMLAMEATQPEPRPADTDLLTIRAIARTSSQTFANRIAAARSVLQRVADEQTRLDLERCLDGWYDESA